jgi:hypothetical protein
MEAKEGSELLSRFPNDLKFVIEEYMYETRSSLYEYFLEVTTCKIFWGTTQWCYYRSEEYSFKAHLDCVVTRHTCQTHQNGNSCPLKTHDWVLWHIQGHMRYPVSHSKTLDHIWHDLSHETCTCTCLDTSKCIDVAKKICLVCFRGRTFVHFGNYLGN